MHLREDLRRVVHVEEAPGDDHSVRPEALRPGDGLPSTARVPGAVVHPGAQGAAETPMLPT